MCQRRDKNQRVSIITQSGKGIGRIIAQKLASQGIIVNINDNDLEAGLKTAEEIITSGDQASIMKENLNRENEVEFMMSEVFHKYGSIDILINLLDIEKNIKKEETKISYLSNIVFEKIKSIFLCSQYALRYMQEQRYGKIINIFVSPKQDSIAKSILFVLKGCIEGMTKGISLEGEIHNIQVNSVISFLSHSGIRLEEGKNIHNGEAEGKNLDICNNENIIKMVLLLINNSNRYLTGHIFEIK